jgi:hypothetical protein
MATDEEPVFVLVVADAAVRDVPDDRDHDEETARMIERRRIALSLDEG